MGNLDATRRDAVRRRDATRGDARRRDATTRRDATRRDATRCDDATHGPCGQLRGSILLPKWPQFYSHPTPISTPILPPFWGGGAPQMAPILLPSYSHPYSHPTPTLGGGGISIDFH